MWCVVSCVSVKMCKRIINSIIASALSKFFVCEIPIGIWFLYESPLRLVWTEINLYTTYNDHLKMFVLLARIELSTFALPTGLGWLISNLSAPYGKVRPLSAPKARRYFAAL